MKRSEMRTLIVEAIKSQDVYADFYIESAEEVLKVIENAGMLPPMTYRFVYDPLYSKNGGFIFRHVYERQSEDHE